MIDSGNLYEGVFVVKGEVTELHLLLYKGTTLSFGIQE